ncbi:MAG TPA: hypothetical protein VEI97_18340, partial [bacterium]|nr:hypothetical protein [bacterium]
MVRVIRSAVPLALGLSLGALLGCSGGSGGPTSPAPAAPGPQAESPAPSSTTDLKAFDGTGGALLIADGTLDWATGEITLTPSQVAREGQLTPVANDRRVIDASPFLTDEPCSDCFRVTGLG